MPPQADEPYEMVPAVTLPAGTYDASASALRPLMDTFWSARGWRRPPAWPTTEVMRRAAQTGVMFASSRTEDHDRWVRAARQAVCQVTAEEAGEAFLASFTSRRLDLRSALGSYAVARFLPEHEVELLATHGCCAVCGQYTWAGDPVDLNVLNFERFKWGGVRRDHIDYVTFDLEQFARAPRLTPTRADIDIGHQLITCLRQLPPATTAARAATQLTMLTGNKAERDSLLGTLGVCGILGAAAHAGYAQAFIPYRDRELPGRRFVDQAYPTCWWTAADGINDDALQTFLPQLA